MLLKLFDCLAILPLVKGHIAKLGVFEDYVVLLQQTFNLRL